MRTYSEITETHINRYPRCFKGMPVRYRQYFQGMAYQGHEIRLERGGLGRVCSEIYTAHKDGDTKYVDVLDLKSNKVIRFNVDNIYGQYEDN